MFRVLAVLVLSLLASTAHAQADLTPERGHPSVVLRPRTPRPEMIVFDGTNHVLADLDSTGLHRVSPAGELVSSRSDSCAHARLAAGGGAVLAVCPGSGQARRFPADLGAPTVTTVAPAGSLVDVAWNGSRFLVVYEDASDLRARFLTAAGGLDGASFSVADSDHVERRPRVVWNGGVFVVVWIDDDAGAQHLHGTTISAQGNVDTSRELVASADATRVYRAVRLVAAGATTFVAWIDTVDSRVYALRLGVDAAPLEAEPQGVGDAVFPGIAGFDPLDLAVTDDEVVFFWVQDELEHVAVRRRFTFAGAPLDAEPVAVDGLPADYTRVSAGPGGFLLATVIHEHNLVGVLRRLAADFTPLAKVAVTQVPSQQGKAAVASDGEGFLVVWQDSLLREAPQGASLVAARFDADGQPLDPDVRVLRDGASFSFDPPAVGFDGENYLVVWSELRPGSERDVLAARVSPAGEVLDPEGFVVRAAPGAQWRPAVAGGANGRSLVTWNDDQAKSAVLVVDGAVSGASFALPGGSYVRPAWNGSEWLAVGVGSTLSDQLRIARVSPTGQVSSATPLTLGSPGQFFPAVASDGAGWLVAWEDSRRAVYGRAVSAAGAPTGPATGTAYSPPGAPDEQLGGLSFDGSRLLVVHETSGTTSGTWAEPTGATIGQGFAIAAGFDPASASTAGGRTLVAYTADFSLLEEGRLRYKVVGAPGQGVPDAGPIDAGLVDAAVGDAGVADADVADAGGIDAGAIDAGARPAVDSGDGCDCRAARRGSPSAWPLLLLLLVLRRYSTRRVVKA